MSLINWRLARQHLLAWAGLIFYEVVVTGYITKSFGYVSSYIFYYAIFVAIFYNHAFWLRKILTINGVKKRALLILLLVMTEILLLSSVAYSLNNIFVSIGLFDVKIEFNHTFLLTMIWRMLYFIALSTGFTYISNSILENRRANLLMKDNMERKLENQTMKTELSLAQNAYLRSQINPHFLFNTLSYIYNKTYDKAPEGAEAILALSDIMRYAVGDGDFNETHLLVDELFQVKRLMKIYKMRMEERVCIIIHAPDDYSGLRIPSLVLVTLFENIIKHGEISEDSPGLFEVRNIDGIISIHTHNLIGSQSSQEKKSEMGLKNIKERLKEYYKEQVEFTYYSENQVFYTNIMIGNHPGIE